jgi:hypothetical protein
MSIGVSGFDGCDVLPGIPYGGSAILWRCDLALYVSVVNTASRRVCAFRMFNDNCRLLFVNVYIPCEGDAASGNEFADQLFVFENIICKNLDCHLSVGGDFNVNFDTNWIHTALLRSFCDSVYLCPIAEHSNYTVDYTYNFNMRRFSVLDHFLVSSAIVILLISV